MKEQCSISSYQYRRHTEFSKSQTKIDIYNLEDLVRVMMMSESGVSVQDRKRTVKTYQKCFVGKETISWLLQQNLPVKNRQDAIEIATELLSHRYIECITSTKWSEFQDSESEFYVFTVWIL